MDFQMVFRILTKASLLLALLLLKSKSRAAKLYLRRLVVYQVYTSDFQQSASTEARRGLAKKFRQGSEAVLRRRWLTLQKPS